MIKLLITLKRKEGMSHDEFVCYQRTIHRPLFLSIPETARYVRRFIVSYPIASPAFPEVSYDSVVEAWFDSEEDMRALYFSANFIDKVDPDHYNFIDMEALGRIVSHEEIVVGRTDV